MQMKERLFKSDQARLHQKSTEILFWILKNDSNASAECIPETEGQRSHGDRHYNPLVSPLTSPAHFYL